MDSSSHTQEPSIVAQRTQECLSLMGEAREDEPANVVILLGETGAGKSSLLEHLTGANGHSMEAADSATKTFQIEKTTIKNKTYYIMDTPGFDHGSEVEVFREIVKGIEAVKPHARIIGVLLLTPIIHTRVNAMDEKLLRFARAFCGDEYLTQVTDVTTFWYTNKEKQKEAYTTRLKNRLAKVGELWSVQEPIRHYQHGHDKGVFLDWDEDRDAIIEHAKNMIHHRYGGHNPKDPQIVQDLGAVLRLQDTAAGQFLGLPTESTFNSSTPKPSASSATCEPCEENAENDGQYIPKQEHKQKSSKADPPKDDPSQSSPSSSSEAPKNANGAQTSEKGWKDYSIDVLTAILKNVKFDVNVGSGMDPSWLPPHIPTRPRYTGASDPLSSVDILKRMGLDSSPEGRAKLGRELGVEGTPGTAKFNNELRRRVERFP